MKKFFRAFSWFLIEIFRIYGWVFPQGLQNCVQHVQWNVTKKKRKLWIIPFFDYFQTFSKIFRSFSEKNEAGLSKQESVCPEEHFDKKPIDVEEYNIQHFRTLREKYKKNWWKSFGNLVKTEFKVSRGKFGELETFFEYSVLFTIFRPGAKHFSSNCQKYATRFSKVHSGNLTKSFAGIFFWNLCSFIILILNNLEYFRPFGETLREGCWNCLQPIPWNVSSKKTFSEKILSFCIISDFQWKNPGPLAKNFCGFSNQKPLCSEELFEKTPDCCEKTLSSSFVLCEKKIGEVVRKLRHHCRTEFNVSRGKFCAKVNFSWILCFIYHFPSLKEMFSVYLPKVRDRVLKTEIWKPNKKFCGGIFFLKLCSFVIFADIEFPSDFRRSFPTWLSKLY